MSPSFLDTFLQTLNVTLWLITALNMVTFIGLLTLPLSEHYSVFSPNNKYDRYLTYIMSVGTISFFTAIGSLILVFNVSADPAFHPDNNPITENIITMSGILTMIDTEMLLIGWLSKRDNKSHQTNRF